MIAAGQVNTDEELEQVINVAKECLKYYVQNVGITIGHFNNSLAHNHYCVNQKQNVHTQRFLVNCGYDPKDVSLFIDRHLFPEIQPDYP
jgi:hypothetical protein